MLKRKNLIDLDNRLCSEEIPSTESATIYFGGRVRYGTAVGILDL